MHKNDFLKLSVINGVHMNLDWCFSVFAIPRITPSTDTEGKPTAKPFYPIREEMGYCFFNDTGEKITIDDVPVKSAIFSPFDKLKINQEWGINIDREIETVVGNTMFNSWCVIPSFGDKIPFQESMTSLSKLEKELASKLTGGVSNEDFERNREKYSKEKDKIYIQEFLEFGKRLIVLKEFTPIFVVVSTRKTDVPPEGLTEFKAELNKKYKGRLHDPIVLAEYEAELKKFDNDFLKGDPTHGRFLSGKLLNTARKEMFLAIGSKLGFEEKATVDPIVNSLYEGQPTDIEQFKIMVDSIRTGSLSRGVDTVKGGVTAKITLRAISNFVAVDGDCGTKLSILRTYSEDNLKTLVGRYIVEGNKPKLVSNPTEAGTYIGKVLKVRSPSRCSKQGDVICRVCAGERLYGFKDGIILPVGNMADTILYSFMKRMHTAELKTTTLDLKEVFS